MADITIITQWQGQEWSGTVAEVDGATTEATLDNIFRFFNRVDDGDHERMAEAGYTLQSLTAGDIIMLEDDGISIYLIASTGFESIDLAAAMAIQQEMRNGTYSPYARRGAA